MSPNSVVKNIPIDSFKAANMSRGDQEESKDRSSSPIMIQEALRLPNISLRGAAESIMNG